MLNKIEKNFSKKFMDNDKNIIKIPKILKNLRLFINNNGEKLELMKRNISCIFDGKSVKLLCPSRALYI